MARVPLQVLYEIAEAIPVSMSELFIEAESFTTQQKSKKKSPSLIKIIETLPHAKKEAIERIIHEALALLPAHKSESL